MADGRAGVLLLNWRDTGHPEGGGSEVYVEQLAAGLARQGVPVTIVCARYPGAAPREQRADGTRIVRLGGRLSLYPLAALAYLAGRLGRPSIVVEVQNGMPFLARLWARGAAVVVLVHHVHREQWHVVLPGPLGRIGWWLESRVAPRINRGVRYVTVSEATRRELAGLGVDPARVTVVPNGTPPTPAARVGRTAAPSLLVVGRLVPHKRVELAVDVLRELRDEFPGLSLVVVGHGWWEDRIRAHVKQRGVETRVRFAGFVDDAAKARLYQQTWVLLVPSLKEGWGLTIVEAGSCGTPAVAFRSAGGTAQSIRDGHTGLLVDEPCEFAGAVARLLRDPALRARLGEHAAAYAATFTWDETVHRFAEVLTAAGLAPAQTAPGAGGRRAHSGPRTVVHDRRLHLLRRRLRGRVDAHAGQPGQDGGGKSGQREPHAALPGPIARSASRK